MIYEIIREKCAEFFRGIIPEKLRHFPGIFRKNAHGNCRKFPNSHPYLCDLLGDGVEEKNSLTGMTDFEISVPSYNVLPVHYNTE